MVSGGEQNCPKADICREISGVYRISRGRDWVRYCTSVAKMVIVITYEFFEPAGCCPTVAGPIGSE